jgi:hypothetical protein
VKPPTSRSNLQSIIEDEVLLKQNPSGTLALFKALGADRVRLYIAWSAIAPNPTARQAPAGFDAANPAAYPAANWAYDDEVIRDAKAAGIGLDVTLGAPAPVWSEGPGEPAGGVVGVWKPSAAEFGQFVRAIGERYSGGYTPPGASAPLPRVDFWSVWNEPNYGQDLAPQAIDDTKVEVAPRLYRALVDVAWSALHATGHGADTILFGETAPAGQTLGPHPGNFDGMVPLRFIRALYCVGTTYAPLQGAAATERGCPATLAASHRFAAKNPALFQASGFADHPYPQTGQAPNQRLPGEPEYADLASLPELEQTLDRSAAAYGADPKLPIYSTEYGYQTDPPEAGRPSPTTAAQYLNWAEYISYENPRVRSYDQYLVLDPQPSSGSSFATGLEFANGMHKATYAAFRMPLFLPVTTAPAGHNLQVWGCVRPAHYAPRATPDVLIQFAAGSSGAFHTVRQLAVTNPQGYFDTAIAFSHSGQLRVAWSYPGGPQIFSRSVSITTT